jgi:acyl-coenzyme A synthetase/AMP-(fatty) acid ligase/acyl carrier protein
MPATGRGDLWPVAGRNVPLDEGGPTDVPFERFESHWIERPIIERFELIVERHGDKIAVDDGSRHLTYLDLMRASGSLASRINTLDVPPGPIAALVPNGALVPVAALACLMLGRPFVPIDCNYPSARREQIMGEAGVRALLVDHVGVGVPKKFAAIPQIDLTSTLAADGFAKAAGAPAEAPAVILYTSGSTGRPKGICINQRSISHRVAEFTNSCHLNPDDRIILLGTAGTVTGIRSIFGALLNGATLFISDPLRTGMNGVLRRFRQERITICKTIPTLFRELMNAAEATDAFANLRVIRLGGESIHARDIALIRTVLPPSCHIQIGYGLTEVGTVFQWFLPNDWTPDGPRVPCGYPMPDHSIWLAREDDTRSSRGEVVVKSRYLALGVWQNGSLQQGPFREDRDDPSSRVLQVGDLIQLREDGLAELVGRKDRQVKIRGLRVHPTEIEVALCRCDNVAEAVVTARPDDESGASLVAYVVPSRPAAASFASDLRVALAAFLPGYMHPHQIRIVPKIPLLPNFKLDMVALDRLDEPALATRFVQERSDTTAAGNHQVMLAIASAWTQVPGLQSLAENVRWQDAGGDSLKKLRLWVRIERALQVQLPYEAFDDQATPGEIATVVERALAAAERKASGPPSMVRRTRAQ